MKTIPILMQPDMVRAILDGRKTQTRRLKGLEEINDRPDDWDFFEDFSDKTGYYIFLENDLMEVSFHTKPKVAPGDIFWVRESIRVGAWLHDSKRMAFDYKASPEIKKTPWCFMGDWFDKEILKIENELHKKGIKPNSEERYVWQSGKSPLKWKPSIHMPKAVCRIWLKVTDVRAERLQSITDDDCVREGVDHYYNRDFRQVRYKDYSKAAPGCYKPQRFFRVEDPILGYGEWEEPKESFQSLWLSINGKESWEKNPWVWVYSFERCEMPDGFLNN